MPTTTTDDIKDLVIAQGEHQKAALQRHDDEIALLSKQLTEVEKKAGRPRAPDAEDDAKPIAGEWLDAKTKQQVHVLEHKHLLVSLEPKSEKAPSIGRVLRGIILGGRADDAKELGEERKALNMNSDPDGGYTVAGMLSSDWIDALRANMVLSQAGARTVPMDTAALTLAKVTGDPTVSWHGENADITATAPTFGSVSLYAKTCVCVVKLSLELAQDAANIEQILQTTITSAMSRSIDSAGMNGVSVDAAIAPSGIFNLAGRSKATGIGAPTNWDFLVDALYTLQASNVPLSSIGAFIAHPKVWQKMRKLKTGIASDNTSLVPPPEIALLPKLWTTAAPFTSGTTCSGVVANWRDLLFGVRKAISVRVLSETFLAGNLQVAVLAFARVDFAATRAESFYTAEGITV